MQKHKVFFASLAVVAGAASMPTIMGSLGITPNVSSVPLIVSLVGANSKTMALGDSWWFGLGYDLQLTSADERTNPRQALLQLSYDGERLDSKAVSEGEVYAFTHNSSRGRRNIAAKLNSVYAGASGDFAVFKDTSINSAPNPCESWWRCDAWTSCVNHSQDRRCYDENNCGNGAGATAAPEQSRMCSDGPTLTVGDSWSAAGGYEITALSADSRVNPREALLRLKRNGKIVKTTLVDEGQTFSYRPSVLSKVKFSAKVDEIIFGATTDLVRLKDITVDTAQINSCEKSWRCEDWTACINRQRTRTCSDLNYCESFANKPATIQSCASIAEATCSEEWTCGAWSECSGGVQNRTCTDANSCGTTSALPDLEESC